MLVAAGPHSSKTLRVERIGTRFIEAKQGQLRLIHSVQPEHLKQAPLRVNDLKKDGSTHNRHPLRPQFSAKFEENTVEVTLSTRRICEPGQCRIRASRPALLPDLSAVIPLAVTFRGHIRR